jgi:hypothetical protein
MTTGVPVKKPVKSVAAPKSATVAKDLSDEIRAFKKWSKTSHARPFEFKLVTEDLAKDLIPELVNNPTVKFAKGDVDPKAFSPYSLPPA